MCQNCAQSDTQHPEDAKTPIALRMGYEIFSGSIVSRRNRWEEEKQATRIAEWQPFLGAKNLRQCRENLTLWFPSSFSSPQST